MANTSSDTPSAFDGATAAIIDAQYAAAERVVNGVRIAVIGLMGVVALLWAPHLTPALNRVNVLVFAPMLTWAIGQHFLFHKPGRRWHYLSLLNTYLDITAVSALLLGYGLRGMPDLAVKSPIWTVYFVILASRPFTGSPARAAVASLTAALQYATVATYFIVSSGLALLPNPLDSVRSSGTSILDEIAKVFLLVVGGMVVSYATMWNERTLRRSVAAMKASEARFRAMFEHAGVGIALLDTSASIAETNAAFERFVGSPKDALHGRKLGDFSPAEELDATVALVREVASGTRSSAAGEVRFVRHDGQMAWGALTISRADAERDIRYIAMVQDVSERKKLEAELLHQAFHDPLTELANRALFRDRVEHALTHSSRDTDRIAVLLLDLDNFKAVNDTQGHAAGDRLLEVVAARLLSATRGCDTVARLGGDEFAVLLEHVNVVESAQIVADRIVNALRRPVEMGTGNTIAVSASVGIAISRGGEGTEELLRNADVAMYAAKNRARGRWVIFDPEMHTALVHRYTLEADLRQAIEQGDMRLAYQPIIDLGTGAVTGIEALLRWTHAERGSVPPSSFIPVAEESGLILPLGRWVLREACRQGAIWNARPGTAPISITVNLSGKQLQHDALQEEVASALRDAGLAPQLLILEITETVIMHETVTTLERLKRLKGLGVRLAIDDFGTGYSSLSYLQQFPVDILKIDRSFTEGLLRGTNDAALVKTIIALANMLTLRTIAEGVEDSRQQDQLVALGCESAQGFLFSRPMTAQHIDDLLATSASAAPPAGAMPSGD